MQYSSKRFVFLSNAPNSLHMQHSSLFSVANFPGICVFIACMGYSTQHAHAHAPSVSLKFCSGSHLYTGCRPEMQPVLQCIFHQASSQCQAVRQRYKAVWNIAFHIRFSIKTATCGWFTGHEPNWSAT